MMKNFYLLLFTFFIALSSHGQTAPPQAVQNNIPLNWGAALKNGIDSCGAYFNNYIGLAKTSSIRIERMRTGNLVESGQYNGRAQKFSAPQPIEVSGVEFYSYIENNSLVDSLMVITLLNEFDAAIDSFGIELARDTVYVLHDNFNPLGTPLSAIAVQSEFDTPVIVNSDYIVSIYTPTDDSLRIIANSLTNSDGAGEGLGFALYDNVNFPTFTGWYDMLIDFVADYDFLISPRVKYLIADPFTLSNTVACVNSADQTCVDFDQVPIFISNQYNSNFSNSLSSITIDWKDGSVDTGIDSTCHTYTTAGLYGVKLTDTLYRYDFSNPECLVNLTDSITINDIDLITIADTVCGSYTGPSGQIWTISGTYVDSLINAQLCDSVLTFELVISNETTASFTETACSDFTSPSGQIWTSSGSYKDTILNSTGCDSVMTFNITITPAVVTNVSDTACFQFTSPSGQIWTSSGMYSDTVQTSTGCDSLIIFYDIFIQDSIDMSFTFSQNGLTANFLTVANNVDSVWWEFGDNTTGSSDPNPSHTYPGPGTYNVWLYSFNGCMSSSIFTTITIEPSSIGNNTPSSFNFYPNPANQKLHIEASQENAAISIFNIAGKLVYSSKKVGNKSTIDISNLSNGTYFIRYETGENTITKKLSIKH